MTPELFHDMAKAVARSEAMLEVLVEGHRGHEPRLRALELWRARALGIVAAVSAAASLLVPKLVDLLTSNLALAGSK